ncbi:peroxiredoxin [Nonomuraea fuscirosea]|uniref:thioredoxin-dependent peroxiredoxin n=1 Tax=Nonomuraea fuscirosea TaxID=1291556 RepID=A0A2T0LKR3_9ACTN|nr:peroxiredoxin-like family protein [Nonomuraea fuscirosea]PRX43538.1 peroxiredoxin [Nonomuraea fuscirosea]
MTINTHDTSIAEQAQELTETMMRQAPAGALSPFAAEQAALRAAGVPAGLATLGFQVPDMPLVDVNGQPTSLYAITGGRMAVLVFYRGVWGPYCNLALRTYQKRLLPQLAGRGVELIGISPQTFQGSLAMQEKNELTFPVLSDVGNQLAARFGILTQPTPDALASLARLDIDVAAANADGDVTVPMPTVAIIDAAHVLRWIDVHPDYTSRTEVPDIIAGLDAS